MKQLQLIATALTISTLNLQLAQNLAAAPDSVDIGFAATAGQFFEPDDFGSVASIYTLPDGKVLFGSNEMPAAAGPNPLQVSFIRFNEDGTVDSTYFSDTDLTGSGTGIYYDSAGWPEVMAIGRQSDGKLVIGGVMQGMRDGTNSVASRSFLRINADDTVDTTFQSLGALDWATGGINYIEDLIIDPDDKIMLAGGFGGIRDKDSTLWTRISLARLNADGSVDPGFELVPGEFGVPAGATAVRGIFYQVVREASGKYYIVGELLWNGGETNVLARLLPNGRRDFSFMPVVDPAVRWNGLNIEPSGSVTALGQIDFNPSVMMRFHPDGTVDDSFTLAAGLGAITSRPLRADAAGRFLLHTGTQLRRLNNDGSVDADFLASADWVVYDRGSGYINSTWVADDGTIYAGGFFNDIDGVSTVKLVRFEGDEVADSFVWELLNTTTGEGNGQIYLAVRRLGGSAAGSVNFATSDASAVAGTDYTSTSGTLNWSAGETGTKYVPISILDNALSDGAREFNVVLSGSSGGIITGGDSATVTILDDEDGPEILQQPIGGAIFSATNYTLTVRLRTSTALSFQWQVDTGSGYADILGATAISYTIANATLGVSDGAYRVIITDATTSIESDGAEVTVVQPAGTLDPSFGHGGVGFSSSNQLRYTLLPDGKLIAVGSFTQFNGSAIPVPYILRLNADGTRDMDWAPTGTGAASEIRYVAVHPDTSPHAGKIVVAGLFRNYNGAAVPMLARLNPDGTFDDTWIPSATVTSSDSAVGLEVLADGSVLVAYSRGGLRKYAPDGSFAFTFAGQNNSFMSTFAVQSDGGVVSAYSTTGPTRGWIRRHLATGELDPEFRQPGPFSTFIISIAIGPDDYIFTTGNFFSVDGVGPGRVARFFPNGERDTSFTVTSNNGISGLLPLQDGSVLLASSSANIVNGESLPALFRVLADGSLDRSFFSQSGPTSSLQVDSSGRYYGVSGFGILRMLPDFGVFQFNASELITSESAGVLEIPLKRLLGARGNVSVGWEIYGGTAVENTDFTAAISGTMSWSNGDNTDQFISITLIDDTVAEVDKTLLLRLVDPSNLTKLGAFPSVSIKILDTDSAPRILSSPANITRAENLPATFSVVAQSPLEMSYRWFFGVDEIAGADQSSYTIPSVSFAKAGEYSVQVSNANGDSLSAVATLTVLPSPTAVDTEWTAPATFNNLVKVITPIGDGRAFVGGTFSSPRSKIAIINADGSIDPAFTPQASTTNSHSVEAILIQPDGKILIGGTFSQFGGQAIANLVRLNPDFSIDEDFLTLLNGAPDFGVSTLALQPDGKILVGGNFTRLGDHPASHIIARLYPDGSPDRSFISRFSSTSGSVDAIQLLDDGRIYLGGNFVNYAGANRVVRIHSDGSRDTTFSPSTSSINSTVSALIALADGGLLLGGAFSTRIARLSDTGVLDSDYFTGVSASGNVSSLALQQNGRIAIGGSFTTFRTAASGFTRINADGSADETISLGAGFSASSVETVALDPDGAIWVGGGFSQYQGITRNRIVRLAGDAVPVAIGIQPVDTAATEGEPVQLHVVASGFGPLSYQWYKANPETALSDTGGINGSTTATLTIANYSNADSGDYFVVVTNAESDSVSSETASLVTVAAPEITTQPASMTITTGQRLLLKVDAIGAGDLNYAWTFNGNPVGENKPYLIFNNPTVAQSGDYRVDVSNSIDSIESAIASVTVVPSPAVIDPAFAVLSGVSRPMLALQDGRLLVGGNFTSVRNQDGLNISRSRFAAYTTDGTLIEGTPSFNNAIFSLQQLKNGRILITGNFTEVDGQPASYVVMLNEDLTLNAEFTAYLGEIQPTATPSNSNVQKALQLPDGRILIIGNFASVSGVQGTGGMALLHPEGTVDTTFRSAVGDSLNLTDAVVDSHGRIILASSFITGVPNQTLHRFLSDGSHDSSFNPTLPELPFVSSLAIDASDNLYVAGRTLRKVSSSGVVDSQYGMELSTNAAGESISGISLLPDGRIVAVGSFTYLGGPSRFAARIDAVGNYDPLFQPGSSFNLSPDYLDIGADGRIFVSGNFATYNGTTVNNLVVLSGDPTPLAFSRSPADSAVGPGGTLQLSALAVGGSAIDYQWLFEGEELADNSRISGATSNTLSITGLSALDVGGYTLRISNASGSLEATAQASLLGAPALMTNPQGGFFFVGSPVILRATGNAAPPFVWKWYKDGELIDNEDDFVLRIDNPTTEDSGNFTAELSNGSGDALSAEAAVQVIRNPAAHLDSFPLNAGASSGNITAVLPLADGGALIGGSFTQAGTSGNFQPSSRIAKILSDGSLDPDFLATFDSSIQVIVQVADGGFLVAGFFNTVNSASYSSFIKLLPNGSIDTDFMANVGTGPSSLVYSIEVLPSGQIMVGGGFNLWNGQSRRAVVRLNSDGSLDPSFVPLLGNFPNLQCLAMQGDKVLVGGSNLNSFNDYVLRLNSNGSIDGTFTPPSINSTVRALAVANDDSIYIGGNFTSVAGDSNYKSLARLMPNGPLDTGFAASFDGNSVLRVLIDSSNRLLVGGSFASISGSGGSLARLLADGSSDPLFQTGSGFGEFGNVQAIGLGPNNSIWAGTSAFTQFNGVSVSGLVALNGGPLSTGGGAPPAGGFAAWAAALPEGQRGPLDQPYNDGIANILRYLFGITGTGPNRSNLPVQSVFTGADLGLVGEVAQQRYLVLEIPVRNDLQGVAWEVRSADNLNDLGNGNSEPAVQVGEPELNDSTQVYRFRSPQPVSNSNRVFMQVSADSAD